MQFDSLDDIRAFCRDLPGGDRALRRHAPRAAQQNLTKPPGSLGRLEELAIWLAQWQGRETPGSIASRSPCSPAITASPRAASRPIRPRSPRRWWRISPPAARPSTRSPRLAGAELRVVPIELDRPTRDFTVAAAMDTDEFLGAVDDRLPHRARGLRSARGRRDGNCEHDDGGDAVRGACSAAARRAGPAAAPASTMAGWRASARRSMRR